MYRHIGMPKHMEMAEALLGNSYRLDYPTLCAVSVITRVGKRSTLPSFPRRALRPPNVTLENKCDNS